MIQQLKSIGILSLTLMTLTSFGLNLLSAQETAPSQTQSQSPALKKAWTQVANLQTQLAHRSFLKLEREGKEDPREVQYGKAITLLNFQPKTSSNIEESFQILSQLIKDNPNDEIGIASKYYLARIHQCHSFTPNLKEAKKHFEELFAQHPKHLLAQLGLTKIILIELFDEKQPQAEAAAKIAQLEKFEPHFTYTSSQLAYHITMGGSHLQLKLDQKKALRHLKIAYETGIPTYTTRCAVLVQVGQLSELVGNTKDAIHYYSEYLDNYPRDHRRLFIQDKRDALQAKGEPSES